MKVRRSDRLPLPLKLLLVYLAGVLIFGKGPTYLGVPPLYWGEVVLVISFVWAAASAAIRQPDPGERSNVLLVHLIVGLIALSAVLLLWDVPAFGIEALRDAAIAYYALFFFVGWEIATRRSMGDRFWRGLQIVWLLSFIWNINWLLLRIFNLPTVITPRGVNLFEGSGSENIQHLFLAGLLFLIAPAPIFKRLPLPVRYLGAAMAFLVAVTQPHRGARIAGLAAILIALWGSARDTALSARMRRPLLSIAVVGLIALMAMSVFQRIDIDERTNLNRFAEIRLGEQRGTHYWRTAWWGEITDAVQTHNPWLGLGFGYNLGQLNPFVAGSDDPFALRAPHNINMSYYGHAGIVGMMLWAGILISGLGALMIRAKQRLSFPSPRAAERHQETVFFAAVIGATWVNGSFGVLMEGPVLGIPFWLFLGFAIRRSSLPVGESSALSPTPDDHEATKLAMASV